ncbi:MGH1-like glycoside hydrolase domain-containing protein [Treponema endosymbiont of Eucomonympha sp.]|uniref:MGH1-like glycoside hydrolase domain-containing protein n=1 Tax=Treponema endosymbiont of Eucomonympha sp. TaxID=1580831 RepID=UPI000784A987|nr:trehalase family glycosidase [Treponema endosymbiont of Eucomonympha sp.]
MRKHDFPQIHFYDQDFVDMYNQTWAWLQNCCVDRESGEPSEDGYFLYPESDGRRVIDQFDSIFSTFFLVYSNRNYSASQNLDYFYSKQESSGAIRWKYDLKSGLPICSAENPEGVGLPLFAWAEFNLYHKGASKRRVKEVMPTLTAYMNWIEAAFRQPNGLYATPLAATKMFNSPRGSVRYPVDFNTAVAIDALFLAAIGDVMNDKDVNFRYKRLYFSLKTRINSQMWSNETSFYHDLDADGNRLPHKTIVGFWPLLAEIPYEERAEQLISHLDNPATFGTEHPFPTLSANSIEFSESGNGFCGSVYPVFNFMVIKGLERYQRWDVAREYALRHLYFILDSFSPASAQEQEQEQEEKGDLWEAYKPGGVGPSEMPADPLYPRKQAALSVGLSAVTVMIENVVGLVVSLPRKTVEWMIPNMESMGIENLALKRNLITILSNKSVRGWEIKVESEKLFYFTVDVIGKKKKTLPIPAGKCSMFLEKL